jgi:hypothetical protein
MVSEKPRDDRCGATVNNKLGLEVHDAEAGEVYTTKENLVGVILERGDVREEEEPVYDDHWEYVNNGFKYAAVIIEDDDGNEHEVAIQDDDPRTIHADTEVDGYCERYGMDNSRCYVHGGVTGGAPEGSVNAMTHGLRAQRSNYYNNLDDEDKAFVQRLAESWIDNAPFDRDNFAKVNEIFRIAVDQHRLWHAQQEFNKGLVTEQIIGQDEQGNPIQVDDENPANLPYDRLDRTTIRKLKELGCLDDPDSQQADATESLADKFDKLSDSEADG